tara:strand:+ start:1162 stop:1368 length:207 start_codon:yes stop_codon:yes gene_type:complete
MNLSLFFYIRSVCPLCFPSNVHFTVLESRLGDSGPTNAKQPQNISNITREKYEDILKNPLIGPSVSDR